MKVRFVVIESGTGFAVKDTSDGSIWTRTYNHIGWAVRAAVKLNEAHSSRKYF